MLAESARRVPGTDACSLIDVLEPETRADGTIGTGLRSCCNETSSNHAVPEPWKSTTDTLTR